MEFNSCPLGDLLSVGDCYPELVGFFCGDVEAAARCYGFSFYSSFEAKKMQMFVSEKVHI